MKRFVLTISMLSLFLGLVFAGVTGNAEVAGRSGLKVQKTTAAGGMTVYGIVTEGATHGIYSAVLGEPSTVTLEAPPESPMYVYKQGVFFDGYYYAVKDFVLSGNVLARSLVKLDPEQKWSSRGEMTMSTADDVVCLAYNAVDKKVHGCFGNDAAGYKYGTLDISTTQATITPLLDLQQKMVAMAIDKQGFVFCIGVDGSITQILNAGGRYMQLPRGTTGIASQDVPQSALYDADTDMVYWFARTADESAVYSFNANAPAAKVKVASFDPALTWAGVFVKPTEKAVQPSWVDDMKASFDKASLTGEISFKLPTLSTDQTLLDGPLGYTLTVDGSIPEGGSGEAQPGTLVTVPVTVTEGEHSFVATATKDGVNGLPSTINKYIGQDQIKAPKVTVTAGANPNEVVIAWDAAAGVHGGYINTAAVKYSIVRRPDNVTIIENWPYSMTSFTDHITSMNYYSYEVTVTDGLSSETVKTDDTLLGEALGVTPPYTHPFAAEGFGFFKPVNANGDENEWIEEKDMNLVCYLPNADKAADDWLMSPPFNLEAGKMYEISLLFICSDLVQGTERFEVKYGTAPTPEAMTGTVCAVKESTTGYAMDEWVEPPSDGQYYIGIHVLSDANQSALAVSDFSISAGVGADSPAAVTDLKAQTADKGAAPVTLSFTCPVKNFKGESLSAITSVTVHNETTGRTVATLTDATPGKAMTAVDDNPSQQANSYTVTCHNDAGAGVVETVDCWVGLDVPGTPSNARWTKTDNKAVITWEAPAEGLHGGYVDPAGVSYSVWNFDKQVEVTKGLTDCTYTDTPDLGGMVQDMLAYQIYASNGAGKSMAALTNYAAFGTGYSLPFAESFADGRMHTGPWGINQTKGTNLWTIFTEIDGIAALPQDEDGGMLVYMPNEEGATRIELPLLSLAGTQRPALKLWYYYIDNTVTLTVKASTDYGCTWTELATLPATPGEWKYATIGLDGFAACDHLIVGVEGANSEKGSLTFIDNIVVGESYEHDLKITALHLPGGRIAAGQRLDATVDVVNAGRQKAESYTVELYWNETLATTVDGTALEPDETTTVDLAALLPINAVDMDVVAKVVYDNDGNMADNTMSKEIKVGESPFPTPAGLTAAGNAAGVQLNWTQPVLEYNPTVVDNLESYEAWSVGGIDVKKGEDGNIVVTQNEGQIGYYKLVDNDMQLTTYSAAIPTNLPNLANGMVCQVIDVSSLKQGSAMWGAHSGDKMFCFWNQADNATVPNDDYLILPELAEGHKYISFWARALSRKYTERFEICVSTTGNAVEDFELFATAEKVPYGHNDAPEAGYAFYEYDLPEETKYVAIHYNAPLGQLALLVDDITFTPAESKPLTLVGYNVYRNNEKVTETPVAEASYNDVPAENGVYRYTVTAVFTEGESGYSNEAEAEYTSDVEQVAFNGGTVYTDGHFIVLSGMGGETVEVYHADGRLLQRTVAEAVTRIPAAPGLYLVKAAGQGQAVVVND